MSIRNYFRPSNGLSEPMGFIRIALKSREQRTSSPPCARSDDDSCYCTFYSTSSSQEQQTHPWYLSRQMSYDSSFFTATALSNRSVFGLSFARQRLSNCRLPYFFYMRGSLKYNYSFRKLFHGSFSLACLSLRARAARKLITLFQTLC